ncbi:hypothetical protein RRG08_033939 [Elysia crispata]|uniref:Uncharacterized protein n=1 Tax=Elysia crispata TaxID=231223 RepID=A0AAE0YCJ8_9GAST|nr:hypothetical protein RRG08_033939 [Elysia crispata]
MLFSHRKEITLHGPRWNNSPVLYVISSPIWPIFSNQENTTFDLVSLAFVLCSFLSMGLIIIPETWKRNFMERSMCGSALVGTWTTGKR